MTRCGERFLILTVVLVLGLTFTPSSKAQITSEKDTCEKYPRDAAPKFKVVRRTRKLAASSLVLFVSAAPRDATRDRLVALSCALGRKYSSEERLFAWILATERAAKRFHPQGEGNDRQTNLAYLGLYGFSREPGDAYGQSLDWKPNPLQPEHLVHIDLGPPPERPAQEKGN